MQFEKLWSLDTPINWQLESRKVLNKIIKSYNKYLTNHRPYEKKEKLLLKIEYGKQTIGSIDGGSGYLETLERMERNVNGLL